MNTQFEQEHEALKEGANKKILKLGLIIGCIMILIQMIIIATKNTDKYLLMAVPEFVLIAGIVVVLLVYRKALKGVAFFGELFSAGFKTTALITLMMVAWVFVSSFIFPDLKELDIANAKFSMEVQKIPSDQIAENIALYNDNKIYYLGKVFNVIRLDFLLGIFITVIFSMFVRAKSVN